MPRRLKCSCQFLVTRKLPALSLPLPRNFPKQDYRSTCLGSISTHPSRLLRGPNADSGDLHQGKGGRGGVCPHLCLYGSPPSFIARSRPKFKFKRAPPPWGFWGTCACVLPFGWALPGVVSRGGFYLPALVRDAATTALL